jgi:hypothetical protein
MFVTDRPFQPRMMFTSKAGAKLSSAPLEGRLLALPTNIRPGWKGLRERNTAAYCEHSLITTVKSLITLVQFVYFSSGAITDKG